MKCKNFISRETLFSFLNEDFAHVNLFLTLFICYEHMARKCESNSFKNVTVNFRGRLIEVNEIENCITETNRAFNIFIS